MPATDNFMDKFESFSHAQITILKSSIWYKNYQTMPPVKRYITLAIILIVSQVFIFGSLYLVFGEIVVIGFFASLMAGLATGLGALPAVFFKTISKKVFNSLLGAAAGVMLAATAFSLLIPGMKYGDSLWPGKGYLIVSIGMMAGAIFLHFADRKMPHIRFESKSDVNLDSLQKIWLFIIAITIHNFPEGMSVGVSFGSGDYKNGALLASAIALQNIPEGLAVALPLIGLGYNKWKAVAIATMTGLVEPIGGLLGVTAVTIFSPLLPIAMGFAAGAMLFVISEEIIPETHSQGRSRHATFSLMIGFIIMMTLDNFLS